ncbi:MAG: ferrochelatase [Cyanobacteria bacterium P01_F01_bin.56]
MARIGILLLNLGGPDKLEDVRPFLYNLFADPEIIRLPSPLLQKPLAWLISTMRAKKSQENYQKIGGGSPLRRITEAQADALQKQLQQQGHDAKVYVAMRYWHPFTEEAIAHIKRDRPEQLVILPLYPQFSISTSGSSFRVLQQLWKNDPVLQKIPYTVVPSWYDAPGYVEAMALLVDQTFAQVKHPETARVFFSAHGVPVSYVEESGDPYQREIEHCAALIMKQVKASSDYTLAYQSRVGPVDWLQPYTEDAIEDLAQQGIEELVVVPISFVSEHIETLEEIDQEYREVAQTAGIETFARVPALNTHPTFIQALTDLTIKALTDPPVTFAAAIPAEPTAKLYPPQELWKWGLTQSAEVWNGRFAMLGVAAVLLEIFLAEGPLHALGLI